MRGGLGLLLLCGVLGVMASGCNQANGSPLGNSFSFSPQAGDCGTPVVITATDQIDPRTAVNFIGAANTPVAGRSETLNVSATSSDHQVQVTPPCDLPSGTYNLFILPPAQPSFMIGQFVKA